MRLQKNTLLALFSALEFAAQPARPLSTAEIARKYRASPHHLAKVLGLAVDLPPEGPDWFTWDPVR